MMKDCPAWVGWVALIVGILYLLTDLGTVTFWGLNWWTVLFLLWGLSAVGKK